MKTKEEIAVHELDMDYHSASSRLLGGIYNAMDAYAKEVAVAFSKDIHQYENDHVRTNEQIFDNWLSIVNASTNQIKE